MKETMENKIVTTENFIDQKELRDKCVDKIERLNKIKELVLIPELDCMSMRQIADFYEVEYNTVKLCYQRNAQEINLDGVKTTTPKKFKEWLTSLDGTFCTHQKAETSRGHTVFDLGEGIILDIPNAGIKLFSKRAIMRFGMLLRDSRVAQELRTQLLNVVEHVQNQIPELLTREIDNETDMLADVGKAYLSGDIDYFAAATQKIIAYQNRHIDKLERQAENLYNDNKALTSATLTISDRKIANRVARCMSTHLKMDYSVVWGIIYKQLKYKFGIDLKVRAGKSGKKKPLISFLKDEEYPKLQKTISAILSDNSISPSEFYKKILDDMYMKQEKGSVDNG